MCLAVPGRVVSLEGDDALMRTARVDFGGVFKVVHMAFLPEAVVGDYVLVHAGVGIAVLDAAEAARTLAAIAALEEPAP